MQPKAIPSPGSWGTKKAGDETVTYQVVSVDPVKEHLTLQRFVRHLDGGVPLFGRMSTLDFKTWRTNRYQPCDPPAAPVPEMLDRQEVEARLRGEGCAPGEIEMDLMDPRTACETAVGAKAAILRAHVCWLDAQAAPPVEVFVSPEPVSDVVLTSQAEIADLKAEIVALRDEVAGLRVDFRALMKAIDAGGQLRLFPVAA